MLQEAIENIKSAIESGRTDVMRSLIVAAEQYSKEEDAEKFSINSVLNSNVAPEGTFLHLATMFNQWDIVRLLLAAGADPGIHNENGRTSLDLISNNAMHAVYVEELLKAAAIGNIGRVCQLVAAGLDINAVDNPESGNTALHWACTFGSYDMVHCLLDREANVNAMNVNGCTPLHDAISHDHVEIVEELLKHGANPHAKALTGKFANISAMELAANKTKIATILQQHAPVFENHTSHQTDECSGSQESALDLFQESNLELNLRSSLPNNKADDDNSLHICDNLTPNPKPTDQLHLLWPQPQQITRFDGKPFAISPLINVYLDMRKSQHTLHLAMEVVNQHAVRLRKHEIEHVIDALNPQGETSPGSVMCRINETIFANRQSYKLKVTCDMINIIASDVTGLHYALCTYSQLLGLCLDNKNIPPIQITDWPNLKYRGVSYDVSKDAATIPTLDHFIETTELLSAAKVNQIFIYSRFLQGYDWPSAYSKQELLKLSYHCHKLHMSLIPALEVDSFVSEMDLSTFLQNYLSCFPDSQLLLLGPNLSKLFFSNSRKIIEKCRNHTLLVTCTAPCEAALDTSSCVLQDRIIIWDHHLSKITEDDLISHIMNKLGISYGLISDISFDKSVCTCLDISLQRIFQQVQSVQHDCALSILINNWSGNNSCWSTMHMLPGFFIAAALGWNCDFSWDCLNARLPRLLNAHIFEDRSQFSGSLVWKLNKLESTLLEATGSNAHEKLSNFSMADSSPLYQLLTEPDDLSLEYLNMDTFQKAIKDIKQRQTEFAVFKQSGLGCRINLDEAQFMTDLILFACRLGKALVTMGQNPSDYMGFSVVNVGISNLHVTTRTDFANKLLGLIEAYDQITFTAYQQHSSKIVQVLNRLVERLIPRHEGTDI